MRQKILFRTGLSVFFGIIIWIGLMGGKIAFNAIVSDPATPGITLLALVAGAAIWLFDWYTDQRE